MSWLDTLNAMRTKDFSKVKPKERDTAASTVVNMCSYACTAVAVSPIPFSDAVITLPIQSAMVITVAHIYGRKITQADAKDLVVELGATAGFGILARQGIKALLPVVGALITIPAAYAANWAIGHVAMEYFRVPGTSRERLRQIYRDAQREAKTLFSKERLESFRKGEAAKKKAVTNKRKAAPRKAAPRKAAAPKKPSVKSVVEGDFAERVANHPEVVDAVKGVIHLDVSGKDGGKWTVDLTSAPGKILRGHQGEPRMTVRASATDFLALVERETDAQSAMLAGDLQLEPMDLSVAAELGRLFA
jgi:uncharacterized protein (DUF697 family)